MTLLFRMIRDAEDWRTLTSERVLSGWYHDADCTLPASESEADAADDDLYTDYGWNTEPRKYPVLASIRAV